MIRFAKTTPVLRDTLQQLPDAYTFIDVKARGEIATHSPRVIFIEVTNQCNQ